MGWLSAQTGEGSEYLFLALTELLAKGHLGFYLFATDDLDALHARLAEGGAEIVSEPADQPWGPRDMAVRDPSGNLLRINQA